MSSQNESADAERIHLLAKSVGELRLFVLDFPAANDYERKRTKFVATNLVRRIRSLMVEVATDSTYHALELADLVTELDDVQAILDDPKFNRLGKELFSSTAMLLKHQEDRLWNWFDSMKSEKTATIEENEETFVKLPDFGRVVGTLALPDSTRNKYCLELGESDRKKPGKVYLVRFRAYRDLLIGKGVERVPETFEAFQTSLHNLTVPEI